jgi:hypothetical protein
MLDRRSEIRFAADQRVTFTRLDQPGEALGGVITDVSDSGMRILVEGAPASIKMGEPVRVDLLDSLVLGEVAYAELHGGQLAIGIEVQHSLLNLTDLAKMRSEFLGERTERREQKHRSRT